MIEQDSPAIYPVGQRAEHLNHTPSGDEHRSHRSSPGSPMRFQVWLRRGLLGPAWAALCGALTSGSLTLTTEPLLRLGLLVLLVEVMWGGLWSALAATDWATPLRHWRNWQTSLPVKRLPYTAPGAPAGRLTRTWGHLRSWWRASLRPALGPTLTGLAVLLPLALIVAGLLGARLLLLTLCAVSLLQFVVARTGGDARPLPGAQALFEIALPWLAGHALFDLPTVPSTLLALSYTLTYAGGLRLALGWPGLARWNLGQVAGATVLLAARQPLAAGVAGLFLLGHAAAQPELFDAESDQIEPTIAARFLRFAQPWLMAAMLVAAWGAWMAGAGG